MQCNGVLVVAKTKTQDRKPHISGAGYTVLLALSRTMNKN
jgi:hypothetical protein